ncbi:MAG: 16S rRNA (guanine(966)-N(2))-methyltransferase RsmD [Desulfofustis sp. PB-SRB1]|jgi:16S rRNA (guanine966-N2)-methyltransferase|nr:16S rRNA (guanine(966)-N(2))-methyltransferase RsmD [Desulfofustis sp. PB-SRB1]MBM1001106.1 16S rRNA (guanine(966)-N(2))-methyltransferase RsmD [Desulfofustis sp. PB-SRB1]HBH29314.1 16S rRNA (guanine(966)-N(2))-methyltransferase RsmD [Desulfofustis sp.]HBH32376.1 16S rRNA (guanine(966)-N(2))-methyltransferase RsmD [Desulfofustis sp.]
MRIIGGVDKGRRLHPPPATCTAIRPTADRVKEALFAIIGDFVRDAVVLDLFAGTGALGCEALSRGARHVHFIDNDVQALNIIYRNIDLMTRGTERTTVTKFDLRRRSLAKKLATATSDQGFNLVFIDPPYRGTFIEPLMNTLADGSLLANEAWVIVEEEKQHLPQKPFTNFSQTQIRRYGDTELGICRFISPQQENRP